jgi:NTP pyrophosphatase (non-canonical NTP hydrolase)
MDRLLDAAREEGGRKSERELIAWRAAIQRMTPGGSEFMDPAAVEAYVADFRQRYHASKVAEVRQRKRAIALSDALQRVTDHLAVWRADHADEGTTETDAAIHCAQALLSEAQPGERMQDNREYRQGQVAEWCSAAFGSEHASSIPQRAVRLLEEAIELAQAAGVPRPMAENLLGFIYCKPAGELHQEIGGVSLCILALATAAGLSAEAEEVREIERVMSKPLEWFAARNKAKNLAGFDVAGAYPTALESPA